MSATTVSEAAGAPEAARAWIDRLGLEPHPEGGFFREVYRADTEVEHPGLDGAWRSAATHIYFLLIGDGFSAFHRVRGSDEIWYAYDGDPVELRLIHPDGQAERRLVGRYGDAAELSVVVPADCWQAARVLGDDPARWSLCGCTVAPGFDFADFDMPGADEILAELPAGRRGENEAIVRELTRG